MNVGRLALVATLLVSVGAIAGFSSWSARPLPQPEPATEARLAAPSPAYRTTTHTVREGETASEVLRELGAPVSAVLAAAKGRLDVLSVGTTVALDFADGDTLPLQVRVARGAASVLVFERDGAGYLVRDAPVPYVIHCGARELTIATSLWEAATDAGLAPAQIFELARIFEYDVDFNTELVKGARVRMVAETLTADDGEQRVGDISAAVLENGRDTFTALRYKLADGTVGWFAPDGTGRRRAFLRSPLEFSRVTSSFSLKRYHPLLGRSRPHYGVDLGAPTGTPVRAVADGVVTTAGRHGGHGNYVELDHDGPYATSYSHLSAILVRRGAHVRQGEIIGRVGSTGLSTGPHLHYQLTVDGAYKNPMTAALPLPTTIPEAEKAAFFAARDEILPMLAPAAAVADGGEAEAE